MSSLAHVLLDWGWDVFGWDDGDYPRLYPLVAKGLHLSADVPADVDVVVFSRMTAIATLARFASEGDAPVLTLYEYVRELMPTKNTVVVSGSCGKSWTTWLIAEALISAGCAPTVIGGAERVSDGRTGLGGDRDFWIIEVPAESSQLSLMSPWAAIVTNVAEVGEEEMFKEFAAKRTSFALLPQRQGEGDSGNAWEHSSVRSGRSTSYRTEIIRQHSDGLDIRVTVDGAAGGTLAFQHWGPTLAANVNAGYAAVRELGVAHSVVADAMEGFAGLRYRRETRRIDGDTTLIVDVAHRLLSIRAVVEDARATFAGTLIVAYQPSSYRELRTSARRWAEAFTGADVVYFLDVHSFMDTGDAGVSLPQVVTSIRELALGSDWYYIGASRKDIAPAVPASRTRPRVVLCIGMYMDWQVAESLLERILR
jgi:UDP-N-acetylmuramate--alanine ligase